MHIFNRSSLFIKIQGVTENQSCQERSSTWLFTKKWSLPYHAYRISHHKLLSQIFSVTQGFYTHKKPLQYMIHNLSAQAVANILWEIQQLIKKVRFFSREKITHIIWWLIMRHTLQLQSLISLFLKVYLSIYLRNLVSIMWLIWE